MRTFISFIFSVLVFTVCGQIPIPLPGGVIIGNGNISPTVVVNASQVITLPTSSANLTGSASDPNGTVVSHAWTQTSGPNTATIGTPSSYSTTVSGLTAGTYVFRLTATDNQGASNYAETGVVVQSSGVLTDTLRLYISAGQSNMDGRANESYPYANAALNVAGIQVWDWKTSKSFKPFEYDRYNGGQTMSTAKWAGDVIVARKIRDTITGVSTYLMKATMGGTSLHPFNTSVGNWTIPQDSVASGRVKMYDTFLVRLNDIRAVAAAQGKYLKVMAIMWHQGENDRGTYAAAYQARLTALFNQMRTDIGQGNVPIILGTVSSSSVQYDAVVHQAHLNMASVLTNVFVIELDGQPLQSDALHFNDVAQTYFGDQMFAIIKNNFFY